MDSAIRKTPVSKRKWPSRNNYPCSSSLWRYSSRSRRVVLEVERQVLHVQPQLAQAAS